MKTQSCIIGTRPGHQAMWVRQVDGDTELHHYHRDKIRSPGLVGWTGLQLAWLCVLLLLVARQADEDAELHQLEPGTRPGHHTFWVGQYCDWYKCCYLSGELMKTQNCITGNGITPSHHTWVRQVDEDTELHHKDNTRSSHLLGQTS